jgi:hypothetical protein
MLYSSNNLNEESDIGKPYKHNANVAIAYMKDCETIFTAF